ncbi:MAG TPA: hypothetical protein VI979_00885 [archaeon]|nr:hypothetical protein [archaeon]
MSTFIRYRTLYTYMEEFYRTVKNYRRILDRIQASPTISARNKKFAASFTERLEAEGISPMRPTP